MTVQNIEKIEGNKATFQVEIDAAEFEKALNRAYAKEKGSFNIPGFRKGKAPRAIIEGMYGPEVFYQDAMDALVPEAFAYGYDNADLKAIGKPRIADINLSEEKVLTYTFEVELYPEVTLGEYKNLSTTKQAVIVDEEQVDKEIKNTLKRGARTVTVEREAQVGDTANIDFDGYLDGEQFDGGKAEGYSIEIGSGDFVPGFEDQLVGMQIGEEKDINVTFPENYVEGLAGKDVVFKVKLNGLSVAELPELDDEYVQDISEFDTVEAYRADVRARLEKEMQDKVDTQFRTDIMNMAVENMTVEVPETMVNIKLEELLRSYAQNFGIRTEDDTIEQLQKLLGVDDKTMEEVMVPAALYQAKQDILLDAIIEAENIEISDEEFDEYVKGAAETVGTDPKSLLSYFGADYIKSEYKKEKATKLIIESAEVSEIVDEA